MKNKALVLVPTLLLLGACGGSTTNTNQYSDTVGNPSTAFGNGLVLRATPATAAQLSTDYSGNAGERVTRLDTPSFSLKKGGGDLVIMTVNGRSYEFTNENRVEIDEDGSYGGLVISEIDDGGAYAHVYNHINRSLSTLIDGSNKQASVVVNYQDAHPDDWADGTYGIAVLGAATNPAALGNFTTTDYSGQFRGETMSTDGFSNRLTRFEVGGDTTLTANFAQNVINGEISNITFEQFVEGEDRVRGTLDGSILLEESAIVGSSFSGVATSDATLNASGGIASSDLEYSGNFYGNSATEASGVLQGTLSNTDGSQDNFVGGFRTTSVEN
jgi:hypothetical protein